MSASDYALHQMKLHRENMLQEVSSHRASAREVERYHLASHRNSLEEQRANLRSGLGKFSVPMHQFYLDRINTLTADIAASRKKYPMFRGTYDND